MLPTRLLAAASDGCLGQCGEAAHGSQPLGDLAPALGAQCDHGVDLLRRVALLAQRTDEAVEHEVRDLGLGLAVAGREGGEGRSDQRRQ